MLSNCIQCIRFPLFRDAGLDGDAAAARNEHEQRHSVGLPGLSQRSATGTATKQTGPIRYFEHRQADQSNGCRAAKRSARMGDGFLVFGIEPGERYAPAAHRGPENRQGARPILVRAERVAGQTGSADCVAAVPTAKVGRHVEGDFVAGLENLEAIGGNRGWIEATRNADDPTPRYTKGVRRRFAAKG